MNCPICKSSKLVISDRKGIEIDYCPDCRGVWLDRGELDKILERTKESEIPRGVSTGEFFDKRREGEYHKPYKRKKSFLEELFD